MVDGVLVAGLGYGCDYDYGCDCDYGSDGGGDDDDLDHHLPWELVAFVAMAMAAVVDVLLVHRALDLVPVLAYVHHNLHLPLQASTVEAVE